MSDLSTIQQPQAMRPHFPGALQEIIDELRAARTELAEGNREAQAKRYEWLIEVLKECSADEREALIQGEDALEMAAYLARHPEEA